MLAEGQFHALESMLTNSDCETFKLLVPELRHNRKRYEEIVRRLAVSPEPCVSRTAREILAEWEGRPLEESGYAIRKCLHELESWSQLEELCWQLTKSECPCLCIDKARRRLDLLAERVDEKLAGRHDSESVLRSMSCVMGREDDFAGNIEDYYNPANSCLDRVLETRRGIPLSLTLVYVFVGIRLGYDIYGLNTKGHYLGRLGKHVFDAFNRGIIVPPSQLAARFKTCESCWDDPEYFRATPFVTARRMLNNFVTSYDHIGDECRCRRMQSYIDTMDSIQPPPSCSC